MTETEKERYNDEQMDRQRGGEADIRRESETENGRVGKTKRRRFQ